MFHIELTPTGDLVDRKIDRQHLADRVKDFKSFGHDFPANPVSEKGYDLIGHYTKLLGISALLVEPL
jgi:hypothetical protein